jgi:decaprenyl-phosphate phosphoribosyltransferase
MSDAAKRRDQLCPIDLQILHSQPEVGIVAKPRPSLRAHVQIARLDHWVKNVFVLPGIVVALSLDPSRADSGLPVKLFLGLLAVCLVASSNYVINELLDGQFDRAHPLKCHRPVPLGQVHVGIAYIQWLALMVAGIALGASISPAFAMPLIALWIMGCVYNIPPLRTKDVPYVDVLSEAINNPLRMLAGWYLTGTTLLPPTSLLISYWMVGCYFMAIKRFAEYREIGDSARSAAYRRSFAFYTDQRLLVSIMFYAAHAMLFFGAFIMRYRLELILAFPAVAWVMAVYLSLAFEKDSAVQRPEGLHSEPLLMASVTCCAALMLMLLFMDVPALHRIFTTSAI